MGGMRWQLYEEKVFWEVIVPRAPPGHDPVSKKAKKNVDHAKQWDWGRLSEQMTYEMERRHPDKKVLRKYDHTLCYEHYFQNYVKRNYSPHAKSFVEAYSASLVQTIDAGVQAANANKTTKTARSTPSKARRQKKTARRLGSAQSKKEPNDVAASAEGGEEDLDQGPSPAHPVNNYVTPTRRASNGPNHDEDDDDAVDQKNGHLAYPPPQKGLGSAYPYYGNNQMFYSQPGYSYPPYGPSNPNIDQQRNASAFHANQGIPANGFPAYGFPAPPHFGDSYTNHGYSYGHGYSRGFDFGHPQNHIQGHGGVGLMSAVGFHAPMHVGRVSDHSQLVYHQSTGEAATYAPPNYAVGMMPNQGMSDEALDHGHGYDSGPGSRCPSSSIVPTERGIQSQAVHRTLANPLRLTPVVQDPIGDGDGYGRGPGPVNPSSHCRNAS